MEGQRNTLLPSDLRGFARDTYFWSCFVLYLTLGTYLYSIGVGVAARIAACVLAAFVLTPAIVFFRDYVRSQ